MEAADPLIGVQFGDFVIEGPLGRGAMGAVYRARQLSVGRPVALKVMRPELAADAQMVARFRREARAAASVSHPHLVQIYSFGEEKGTCFFAMEYVEGSNLRAYLKKGERFTEAECLEIGRQAIAGLREAHKAGVIHRDIKPDNLMLDTRGQIKVADLGLARIAESESSVELTLTGMTMGTPLYMAPEQVEGRREVDYRTDFYAFGATLFHLATGRAPYAGDSAMEVMAKHLNAPVPQARSVNPELSPAFSDLIARLMGKKPEDRPSSHAEVVKALDRCGRLLAEEAKAASRIAASQALKVVRRSWADEPVTWIAASVVAAALIAAGGLYMKFSKGPSAHEVLGVEGIVGTAEPSGRSRDRESAGTGQTLARSATSSSLSPPAPSLNAAPFINSLGMKFVPISGTQVLFSVWETRVRDFEAFVKESGYAWSQKPSFAQTPEDPVVMVSWHDAKAFCAWLSKKERREYRLPTDEEWDAAVGKEEFPWGNEWPPPAGTGNFAGEESKLGRSDDPKEEWMTEGYRDEHARTAPVGSYRALSSGLYDLVGNVWEWCEDWYDEGILEKCRAAGIPEPTPEELADIMKGDVCKVLRGGSWYYSHRGILRSSNRGPYHPDARYNRYGFRCVVVASGASP